MFLRDWVPGRDSFLHIMHDFGLTLPKPKPRHTTNSNHRYHKYKNLIKGFVPTAPNQLWVSDITYIDLVDGCCYLHLVTDAYSHKIVGWCLSETLEAQYVLQNTYKKRGKIWLKTDIFPLIFLLFLLLNSEFFAIFGLIYDDCVAWIKGFVEE